jgi:anaerobic magnesium-protoporphyrin IX monomethyl ester cyclase
MRVLFFHRNAEWLGIEYLSSALKKAGHETDLIFDPGSGDVEYKFEFLDRFSDLRAKMIERARAFKPDLVAFSCLTNLYPWVSQMAHMVKTELRVPVIVGGLHPTILPEFVIKNPDIDMICIGEGEEALVEVVNSMAAGALDHTVKNIWFKVNGRVIRNDVRPLIRDLDALAFPDKDLFRKYGCFSSRVYVMTGRGCPYQCTYCFNSYYRKLLCTGNSPYVRRRSVGNVIEELKFYKSRYHIKEVFFYDDIFTINNPWIIEFAGQYKKYIGLPFKILIHPQSVQEDVMRLLVDAGCIYVDMGVESGSEEIRRNLLKRNMTNDDIVRTAAILKKVGLKFCTLNIVGFPTETREQMWQTYELNEKIRPDGTIVSIFYPFPKTELAEYSLKNGFLDDADYEKICNGEGGYKEGSLLKNIEISEAQRLQIMIPLLTRLPRFLHPAIRRIPVNSFSRILSIFFLSIPRNTLIRIKESASMFFKSHWLYLFTRCRKKGHA